MKKIYYLQKQEVELGDLIAYKDFKATVTEELIELNPELFRAEILPLKFTTEDGVGIYGDMKTYLVPSNDSDITSCHGIWNGNSKAKCDKYFYHKENALAYIEKHKEKTLEDYEEILFERGNSMICSSGVVYFSVYGWLKYNEPKLYYTKILQLIADDLNDGW